MKPQAQNLNFCAKSGGDDVCKWPFGTLPVNEKIRNQAQNELNLIGKQSRSPENDFACCEIES